MASLTHEPNRPRKPWKVDWRERGGRKTCKRFPTKREAEAWIVHLRRGAAASTARLRLADWLEQWIRQHGPQWAESTLSERQRYAGRVIAPSLGRLQIGELTRPDIRNWRSELLLGGATPKSANAAVRVLSAALGAAVTDDVLGANPCQGLRPLPTTPVDREPATLDEVEAIRAELTDPLDRLVVSLLAYGGLRPGEARQLQWRDVRPQHLFILRAADAKGAAKTTKTGGARTVPIIEPLADDLEAARAGRRCAGGDLVVPTIAASWDNWTGRRWRPARRRAETEAVPYALRHTYASLLIAEGRSVFDVAPLLGHSTPALTMSTYGHLFTEAQIATGQDMATAAAAAREKAPAAAIEREAMRAAVDRAVTDEPATVADLAEATGYEVERVAGALQVLIDQRRIEKVLSSRGMRFRRRRRRNDAGGHRAAA